MCRKSRWLFHAITESAGLNRHPKEKQGCRVHVRGAVCLVSVPMAAVILATFFPSVILKQFVTHLLAFAVPHLAPASQLNVGTLLFLLE